MNWSEAATKLETKPESVRAGLLYLRKGSGFSQERLRTRSAVLDILGGPNERPDLLAERFESAIASLADEDAELLFDVFALSDSTTGIATLAKRRDCFAAKHGIGRDAVADRDSAAIERLLAQLITGWYPKSPIPVRVAETHNGAITFATKVHTIVRDHRHLETRVSMKLFVLFDGAEFFRLVTASPSQYESVSPNFALRTVEIEGGHAHEFWHKEPMRSGTSYDLHYVVRNPDPNEPYWLCEESLAFHEPTRFARFEVEFRGAKPAQLWKIDRLTAIERPGRPTRHTLLDFGEIPALRVDYRDLYGGLFSGVAWNW